MPFIHLECHITEPTLQWKFSGSIIEVQLALVGLVLVILVNYPPFFLLVTKSPKSFVMGEGQDGKKKKKQRGKRCVSRNALSWVLSPFFTRHFLYDNSSDYKPTHGQKKLLESHFPIKRAPTNNRPKSPDFHFALPSPSVFMELLCQVQKKQFILNSRFPSLEHNKLPSPRHSANL